MSLLLEAMAHLKTKRYGAVVQPISEAMEAFKTLAMSHFVGVAMRIFAEALHHLGRNSEASCVIRDALDQLQGRGNPRHLYSAYRASAVITGSRSHAQEARRLRAAVQYDSAGETGATGNNSARYRASHKGVCMRLSSATASLSVALALIVLFGASTVKAAAPMGNAAAGKKIFSGNCASCHGATGAEGGVGPSLKQETKRKNYAQIVAWIKNPSPPMPKLYPSPLSEKDVQNVAAYVATIK